MYVLTELGYVLICQVKEKEKKCSFENALVEKSESSTRNKNGLVEGLLLFSIFFILPLDNIRVALRHSMAVAECFSSFLEIFLAFFSYFRFF